MIKKKSKNKSVKHATKITKKPYSVNKFFILSFVVFGIIIFVFFNIKNNPDNITDTQKNNNISKPIATPIIDVYSDVKKYNYVTEKIATEDKKNPYFKYQNLEWVRNTELKLITYLSPSKQNNNLTVENNGDIKIETPSNVQIIPAPKNDKYKYLAWGWDCGGFTGYVFVLTENGQIYKLNFHPFDNEDKKSKSEITKIVLPTKIIDMTLKTDIVSTSCSYSKYYFLTSDGQLIDVNNNAWEKNNPHISVFGNLDSYINIFSDGSFSLKKNKNQKINDQNSQIIKIAKVFSIKRSSFGYLDFYIIDDDNKIFKFSPIFDDKLGISNTIAIKYTNKIVKNIQSQFEPIDTITVDYNDGSRENFVDSSHGYYDFIQKKDIY